MKKKLTLGFGMFLCLMTPAIGLPMTVGTAHANPPAKSTVLPVAEGRRAPDFRLTEVDLQNDDKGQARENASSATTNLPKTTLSSLRGRPVALFFVCGCPLCTNVVRQWTLGLQNSALLKKPLPAQTLLVFDGNESEARVFAQNTGVMALSGDNRADALLVRLVLDSGGRVSERSYGVNDCPQAVIIDTQGMVSSIVPRDDTKNGHEALSPGKPVTDDRDASAMVRKIAAALTKLQSSETPRKPKGSGTKKP